jgi:redox-sensitive bicupin YhaK (pirin superfamily)
MSAGTHFSYEYKNKDQQVKFLQIWIYPNRKNKPLDTIKFL